MDKNKVNRVKSPYICSNWPKTVKKTLFWPQNDVIRRNWGEIWQKNFQHYLLLLLTTPNIYFLRVKTKLKGSWGHIYVQNVRKWPKWRHFSNEMTAYVEIGVRYDKYIFSTLSTLTIEPSHIYYFWVKTKLTGSKGHYSCSNWPRTVKKTFFGHKMTSYVKTGVRYDKKFFQQYLILLQSHLIYTFCG